MTIRSGRHTVIPAFIGTRVRAPASAAVIPWYLAGGAPTPVAAYQPKGAASYAASKTNLATPGTYDAADGTAYPTWAAATGWTFAAASSQFLTTGLTPGANWSGFVRYTCAAAATGVLLGAHNGFGIRLAFNGGVVEMRANGAEAYPSLNNTGGVLSITGAQGWYNTSKLVTIPSGGGGYSALRIGRAPWADWYLTGSIQCAALYSSTLTDAQAIAVISAMAAL